MNIITAYLFLNSFEQKKIISTLFKIVLGQVKRNF